MKCNGIHSCSHLNYSISVNELIDMQFTGQHEWYGWLQTIFKIELLEKSVAKINCSHDALLLNKFYGSCYGGSFVILSSSDYNNAVSMICGYDFDCALVFITLNNVIAEIECIGSSSCRGDNGGSIFGFDAQSLDVICNDENSCLSTSIFCPYYSKNICNITCGNHSDSCSKMQILYDYKEYINHFLELSCPYYLNLCNNVEFGCIVEYSDDGVSGGYGTTDIHYEYDNITNEYYCAFSSDQCCPWFITEDPTYNPTYNPTMYRSRDPTSAPIVAPTSALISAPTSAPTSAPIQDTTNTSGQYP
eukprot:504357_1